MKKLELLTGKLTNSKSKSSLFGDFFVINFLIFCVLLTTTSCSSTANEISESNLLIPTKTSFVPTAKPVITNTNIVIESSIPQSDKSTELIPMFSISKVEIYSPLKDITIDQLQSILSNPFQFPTKGKDDGHPGIDFSFYTFQNWNTINNHDVISIYPGKIAGIIHDRPPYGNAVIIETDINSLDVEIREFLLSLYPDNPLQHNIILQCPKHFLRDSNISKSDLALYILYGHLATFNEFKIGDTSLSGNIIGQVGNTGYSGNPHLHLEMRIGPKSATFLKMAHYDNSVTSEEIENYCFWRVSGYFYPIDPFVILTQNPTKP